MTRTYLLLFLLIFFYSVSYSQKGTVGADSKKAIDILFIGNSLTYTNNLPNLVKRSAKQHGTKINSKMIALPNYAIADHWNEEEIQKLIASKKYDYVVIQQGPSSQSDGRKMLMDYGKKYSEICATNDAKLCFFMVWPSLKYFHTFEGVVKNYRDAAVANKSILLPVGEVWKEYIEKTNDLSYYGPDGFHPSLKGSQIAADVIVDYLFKD